MAPIRWVMLNIIVQRWFISSYNASLILSPILSFKRDFSGNVSQSFFNNSRITDVLGAESSKVLGMLTEKGLQMVAFEKRTVYTCRRSIVTWANCDVT